MRILGIDPGYGRMGYGVVDREGSRLSAVDFGVIDTPKVDLPARLAQIHRELTATCDAHRPDCLATEKLFFTKNQTTGIFVGAAEGLRQRVDQRSAQGIALVRPIERKNHRGVACFVENQISHGRTIAL